MVHKAPETGTVDRCLYMCVNRLWMQLYECDARVCGAREVSNSLPKFETEVGPHKTAFVSTSSVAEMKRSFAAYRQ